ncbi:MAG: hypothetical protein WD929_06350, partial [Steroidobacteraceae bacterium]
PLTRGAIIFHPLEETTLRLLNASYEGRIVEVLLGASTGSFPTAPDQAYLLLVAPRPAPMVIGTLVPGTYENAAYYRLRHDVEDKPVLSLGVNHQTCVSPRGRFVLHDVAWGPTSVTRLAVDVQQTCEPTGRYLWAQIRLNSTVPIRSVAPVATAGPDLVVPAGREFVLDGIASGSWFDPQPSFQWRQTGGVPVSILQPGSRTTTAVAAPFAAGQAISTLELEVADALGRRSVDSVNVTVLGADQPFRAVDVARIRTVDGTTVVRMRHDPHNAYFQTADVGTRQRVLQSFASRIFGLAIRANIEDRIPIGNMKMTAGIGTDLGTFSTQIALDEIDEFNDLRQCATPDGAIRIAEAEFTIDGFTKLAIDFDLRCPDGWTYRGVSRFNSAVPIEQGRVFAYAGEDREVIEGSSYTLDGTASLIVGAGISQYRWRQLAGPAVVLTTIAPGIASLNLPHVSTDTSLRFELEVIGEQGERGTDEVTIIAEDISVAPPPPPPPPPPRGGGGGGGALPPFLLAGLFVVTMLVPRRRRAAVLGA